jgi:hypothetical protein
MGARIMPVQTPSAVYGDKSVDYELLKIPKTAEWVGEEGQPAEKKLRATRELISRYFLPGVYPEEGSPNTGRYFLSGEPREEENPTTSQNLVDDIDKEVKVLILSLGISPFIRQRKHLAERLGTLYGFMKEEEPTSPGISVGSLRTFYTFYRLNPELKKPSLSLAPNSNIYASWRFEDGRVFSILFLPDGDARYVILKPNERHPDRQIQVSGTLTVDILMEKVMPYGVLEWLSE